jgi:plasmid stabilization system protein ParE
MRVRYRELALADLEQIFQYLDERSPAGARNVIEAIRAAISNAADQPLSGRKTSDPAIPSSLSVGITTRSSTALEATRSRFCMCAMGLAGLGSQNLNSRM